MWRDAINDWFHQLSDIPDAKGRVGNHPHRVEAESMQLQGYVPVSVTPWEDASAGKAVECVAPAQSCSAQLRFAGKPGHYEIDIQYFDQNNGVSKYRVFVGQRLVDEWLANASLPATEPNGDSSTRRTIRGIMLRPGDELRDRRLSRSRRARASRLRRTSSGLRLSTSHHWPVVRYS